MLAFPPMAVRLGLKPPMRYLKSHIVPGDAAGHQLTIAVVDEPGPGGENHEYHIDWPALDGGQADEKPNFLRVSFQNGAINVAGVNGVTNEALLAIVIDRLQSFQAGPFACPENEAALMAAQLCLAQLQARTRARIARGVEGTHNA